MAVELGSSGAWTATLGEITTVCPTTNLLESINGIRFDGLRSSLKRILLLRSATVTLDKRPTPAVLKPANPVGKVLSSKAYMEVQFRLSELENTSKLFPRESTLIQRVWFLA